MFRGSADGKDVPLAQYCYAVRNEQNQRENNEDSFLITALVPVLGRSPLTILAVADGMGGHAHGEDVSQEALKKFSLALFEKLVVEPSLNRLSGPAPLDTAALSKALMNALEQTNKHVRRMVQNNNWQKAGSTIVAAAILESDVVVANLGDSALFHYQAKNRQLVKITEDHTVAGVLLRAGMITPEMARFHEGADRLEFYVGAETLPREEPLHRFRITPGDVLLLCSDGISGSLSHEQIARILIDEDTDLEGQAERFIRESLAAGETDNQTLLLWQHQNVQE